MRQPLLRLGERRTGRSRQAKACPRGTCSPAGRGRGSHRYKKSERSGRGSAAGRNTEQAGRVCGTALQTSCAKLLKCRVHTGAEKGRLRVCSDLGRGTAGGRHRSATPKSPAVMPSPPGQGWFGRLLLVKITQPQETPHQGTVLLSSTQKSKGLSAETRAAAWKAAPGCGAGSHGFICAPRCAQVPPVP